MIIEHLIHRVTNGITKICHNEPWNLANWPVEFGKSGPCLPTMVCHLVVVVGVMHR